MFTTPILPKNMASCFHVFSRCISNRSGDPDTTHYRTKEIESIKFENLLTIEQREKDSRIPIISESELQHVREGRLDRLAEEQMKLDQQKDEELRKEEEQLRKEEEAYYAAKRKAARKPKQPITTQPTSRSSQNRNEGGKKTNLPSWLTDAPSVNLELRDSSHSSMIDNDEEDFDIFLKNVKAKSTVLAKQSPDSVPKLHSITSDDEGSEEEIDFGYWESAVTSNQKYGENTNVEDDEKGLRSEGNLKEVDLNLL